MAKETTYAGMLGDLRRLAAPLAANAAELPHLEGTRLKLEGVVTRAGEVLKEQAAFTAAKQEASKEIRDLLREGQRLANVLRLALKEHYGIRAEKLADFGLQPFRGRPRVAKPAPEAPAAAPEPAPAPPAPADPDR
jgi:hypothetical protein